MKTLSALALAFCFILLNGCAIVPGQRVNESALQSEDSNVKFMQITPDLVQGEQQQATIPAELTSYKPEDYQIGAGDTLYITVWDHPELTSPAGSQQQTLANGRLVRPDGTLFYPYAGTIQAAGKTIEQLRQEITRKLSSYVRDPQVDVSIVGYGSHRVTLAGAFQRSEPQQLNAVPLTLSQAIGAAGVDPQQADLSGLVLTRDGKRYPLDMDRIGNAAQAIYLKPGDRIYLPYNSDREVYVVGEVEHPQPIPFRTSNRMTLTQALGRAGGLNPVTSSGNAVYVIRGSDRLSQTPAAVYHLNARSPAAFALADDFAVKPGDVVFVGAAAITKWNRVLSQLLPLSGFIYQTARTQNTISNN